MFTQRQREAPGLRLRMQTFITTTALCACAALSGCSGEATPALASRRAAVSYLEQAVLNDPLGNAQQGFGSAVAVQGDTALIGIESDDQMGSYAGAARVYARTNGAWTLQQVLLAYDGHSMDFFGRTVALSGDTAVVGSPGSGSTGAAYVYTRSGATWTLQSKLLPSNNAQGTSFGNAVAIDADTVVVGGPLVDDAALGSNCGAVYVYTRSNGAWSLPDKLLASLSSTDDMVGTSVAVSGATVFAGAPMDDDLGVDAGASYAFTRSGAQWSEAKLKASDGGAGDGFGAALAAQGGALLVGSPGDDDLGLDAGAAYVFTNAGGAYAEVQKLRASDGQAGDAFGADLGLSATGAVIGARFDDDLGASAGAAYVFIGAGLYLEQEKLHASDGAPGHKFGLAVAIDGSTALVSAEGANSGKGQVYVEHSDSQCVVLTRTPAQPGICADSYIATDFSDPTRSLTNYGGATSLHAGEVGLSLRRGLLQFDATSLPVNSTITNANLFLRQATAIGGGAVTVHALSAPFSEATVTWSSFAAAFDPQPLLSFSSSATNNGRDLMLDVLGPPMSALSGAGLLLEKTGGGRIQLGASEAPNALSRPRLLLCYQ